jgi:uncharacterized OB-fold protein
MTEATSEKKRLPLRPGRFVIPEDPNESPYVMGGRCGNCGKYFLPTRVICLNCGEQKMEPARISGKGVIYSYTVVHQPLPNALVKPPYAIVIVALEEGCQTHGVVTDGYEKLKIGMAVEQYFEVMKQDADGNDLYAEKFRSAE